MVSPQVIQGCGNPKVNLHGSGPEEKRRHGKLALQEKTPTGTLEKLVSSTISVATAVSAWEGTKAGFVPRLLTILTAIQQVSEAKAQLRDIQDFWISLPGTLCSEKMAMSPASDDRCWNGISKGRWVLTTTSS